MNRFVKAVVAASMTIMLIPSIAQEADEKPEGNQTLLDKLEKKVNQYSESVQAESEKVSVPVVSQPDPLLGNLPLIQRNDSGSEGQSSEPVVPEIEADADSVESGDIEVMADMNLLMPLRELPTGSRFTFTKTLFFPANTVSLLYSDGMPVGKVYEGGDPLDNILSMTNVKHSACAIISDKSYIKFRGNDTSTNPTFIDFDKLEYIRDGESNRIVYRLNFKAKAAGEHSILISMACVLPANKNEEVSALDMNHIVEAFGQSFNFKPPKYVEL